MQKNQFEIWQHVTGLVRLPASHMESVGLKKEDAVNMTKWKNDIHNHSSDPR